MSASLDFRDHTYEEPDEPKPECEKCKRILSSKKFSRLFGIHKNFRAQLSPIGPPPEAETFDDLERAPHGRQRGKDKTLFHPSRSSTPVRSDPFFKSESVYELNTNNFKAVVGEKKMTFVMFYDPEDEKSKNPKKVFTKFAESLKKEDHNLGAVNCRNEGALCLTEQVTMLPSYKIYSKGQTVKGVTDASDLKASHLMVYLDSTKTDNQEPKQGAKKEAKKEEQKEVKQLKPTDWKPVGRVMRKNQDSF